jgi:2-polyprenyl-3-methyl-5-hydroxy-6-metoxy-1,4-benzoquinol methylase
VTSQQQVEVGFWRRCFVDEEGGNAEKYLHRRWNDYRADAGLLWSEIEKEVGLGLDLGCGLVSTLGFKGTPIVAVDPLLFEYDKIFSYRSPWVNYRAEDGEELSSPANSFDYVWCINVIDHTPNPERMVSEIRRVLKPGGHLYFSVNYDPELQEAHYALWTRETVDRMLVAFHLLTGITQWRPEYRKYTFTGLYEQS